MEEKVEIKNDVKKASFWPFIAWPVAVLVFYLLSLGPLALLVQKRVITGKARGFLAHVYIVPMDVICKVPIVETAFEKYVDFWLKLGGAKQWRE